MSAPSDKRRKLTDEQRRVACVLSELGVPLTRIARQMGVSTKAIRYAVDPEFRARDSEAASRRQSERYRTDPEYRQRRLEGDRARRAARSQHAAE